MNDIKIGLIGLGVIGAPIAYKLYNYYDDSFFLVADEERKNKLNNQNLRVNNEIFVPNIISNKNECPLSLLIVCVKNYDLEKSISDFKNIIDDKTIILPLQNGVFSYEFFCENFKNNIVLRGYVQGPNTRIYGSSIIYSNPGTMHIGKTQTDKKDTAYKVFEILNNAGIDVVWEDNIKKMVWKKWMLNVAGNSITALTLADYSYFSRSDEIQRLCRNAMHEFLLVAQYENVDLIKKDIDDIINYYVNYRGKKKTSMLEDILHSRPTENEFLAGDLIRLAKKNGISTPMIETLYLLLKIRENQYITGD
ncbi:ketopantoate reductase family protein [Thomasclavelia cocleata]|uniref:ketopantoate reductase family protein n=1 Tax=Thomasclavelia cocleata TaxID=69824 RepID=UPI0024953DC7|nr:ketopantoate reductase family protein [Thomasclavelia cocleata]